MEKQNKTPVAGEVVKVCRHPNADYLYIAKINVGAELVSVIFGGKRILKAGELVPIALPGTRLFSGEKIRSRNWRGIKSYGELLSSNELGWTVNGSDEVMVLSPADYQIGAPVY